MSGEGGQNRPQSNTMSSPKNNTTQTHQTFKGRREKKDLEELFLQWLTTILRDTRGRAVIRSMVEQHELPVIENGSRTRQR